MSDRDETPRSVTQLDREVPAALLGSEVSEILDYIDALAAKLAEAEQRAERLRRALGMMVNLHRGKLLCASDETDRQCLNRVTAETLSAADAALKG